MQHLQHIVTWSKKYFIYFSIKKGNSSLKSSTDGCIFKHFGLSSSFYSLCNNTVMCHSMLLIDYSPCNCCYCSPIQLSSGWVFLMFFFLCSRSWTTRFIWKNPTYTTSSTPGLELAFLPGTCGFDSVQYKRISSPHKWKKNQSLAHADGKSGSNFEVHKTFLELRSKTAMQHSQTSEEKNPKLASHSLSKIQRSLFFNTLF